MANEFDQFAWLYANEVVNHRLSAEERMRKLEQKSWEIVDSKRAELSKTEELDNFVKKNWEETFYFLQRKLLEYILEVTKDKNPNHNNEWKELPLTKEEKARINKVQTLIAGFVYEDWKMVNQDVAFVGKDTEERVNAQNAFDDEVKQAVKDLNIPTWENRDKK